MKLPPVSSRIDRMLLNLSRWHPKLGDTIYINPADDYPIGWSLDEKEFLFLLNHLVEVRNIRLSNTPSVPWETREVRINVPGWNRIDELQRAQIVPRRRQGFIAVWFDADLADARENGLKAGIVDAHYEPLLIDEKPFNTDIHDEILSEIRKSRFVVADFTGHRPNVYYEAGFADALSLPVIYSCRADDIERAHFDIRQRNHIVWTTPEDLRLKLTNRIGATIGPPE